MEELKYSGEERPTLFGEVAVHAGQSVGKGAATELVGQVR